MDKIFLRVCLATLFLLSVSHYNCWSQNATNFTQKFGVINLEKLDSQDSKSIFKIKANSKIVNDYEINIDNFTFELTESNENFVLHLYNPEAIQGISTFPETMLRLESGRITDLQSNIEVADFDLEINPKFELQIFVLLSIFDEIKNPKLPENTNEYEQRKADPCMRTIVSFRTTKSKAEYYVNSAVNAYIKAHPDCSRAYGLDSGCIWGDYGCVATQEILCTGGGCQKAIGYF